MTFGNKLQALRARAGLSQEELAARLGVSRGLLGSVLTRRLQYSASA